MGKGAREGDTYSKPLQQYLCFETQPLVIETQPLAHVPPQSDNYISLHLLLPSHSRGSPAPLDSFLSKRSSLNSCSDPVTLRRPVWSTASQQLLPRSSWPDEKAPLTSSCSREPLCWRWWSSREPCWRSTASPFPRTSVCSTRRQPPSRGSWHYRSLQKNSCH